MKEINTNWVLVECGNRLRMSDANLVFKCNTHNVFSNHSFIFLKTVIDVEIRQMLVKPHGSVMIFFIARRVEYPPLICISSIHKIVLCLFASNRGVSVQR